MQIVGSGLFQALGKAGSAFVLHVLPQVIFGALVLALPAAMGLWGIWFSYPLSGALAYCVTIAMITRQARILSRAPAEPGIQPA